MLLRSEVLVREYRKRQTGHLLVLHTGSDTAIIVEMQAMHWV